MSRARLIRNRGRRKTKEPFEIDITSLLDILVIMLVFLLRSYNSSGIVISVPKGITLPISESQSLNTSGVIVQVAPTSIHVDNKLIIDMAKAPNPDHLYDHGGRRIIPLFDELVAKKQQIKELEKRAENAKKFSGVINLVVDKTIRYNYLKKLMYTCAEAGFKTYKFVVLAQDE